jgi:phosphoribosylglycinamide formyltransferase-1
MVNLLVDLDERRFGAEALAGALRGIEAAGYAATCGYSAGRDGGSLGAWIDDVFGGTWSSEADAGTSVVASRPDGDYAGFATYDPKGLQFRWLRGLGALPDVGIFGPFGVGPEHRKSGIGPHLLVAALASLKKRGYDRALVPAVGEEKLVEYYTRHAGARVVETFDKREFFAHRYRTLVLASGNGSNFQAVLEASREGRLPLDVTAVLCNRPGAYVFERAEAASVRAMPVVWNRPAEARATFDRRLLEAVRDVEPELVLLLGWMHLFDDAFVRQFGERTINIHPAYLPLDQTEDVVCVPDRGDGYGQQPAFRGAHAVRDALAAGAKWTGATAHMLGAATDRGRVLVRKAVRLPEGADPAAAIELLRPVEQKVVAGGIMRWVYER